MYRLLRWLRILFTLALVGGVIGGVAYFITLDNTRARQGLYDRMVTAAVETAVTGALYGATRTAEAPLVQYQVIQLGENESLLSLAEQHGTTLEIIQMVNGLQPDVTSGSNVRIIMPQGLTNLDPPRRLRIYTATAGDTLAMLAMVNEIPLAVMEADNPALVNRTLNPGDTVFIAQLL